MTSLLHTPKLQLVDMACIKASKEEHSFNVGEVFNKMRELSNDITIVGNDGEGTVVNRLLLGVCSPTLRPIIFDQLDITPTIVLPDMSSSTIKHLVNLVTVGSSIAQTIAFKELHEITEAAKILGIDLTDIAWESIQYKPKVMVEDVEASENDVVRHENGIQNAADGNGESIKIIDQSNKSGDEAIVVKDSQSSINSKPLGTDDQTLISAQDNDKADVQEYQDDNNKDLNVGVMDDQSNDNIWKNKASITDNKIDIEIMDHQDIGSIMDYHMDYQPRVMSDKVNDALEKANVSSKDDLVHVMDNSADNQICANIADNQADVNVPDNQAWGNMEEQAAANGDLNHVNIKAVLLGNLNGQSTAKDDQNIVRIVNDKVTIVGGLTDVVDINNEQSSGVNLKNDHVGATNGQNNVIGGQTNVQLKDNEVGVTSMDDQAKNYQTYGDVMNAQVSANGMNGEASILTDQTNVMGESYDFIDGETSLTRDQDSFKDNQTSFMSDLGSPMGEQSNFMDNETPSLRGDHSNYIDNETPIMENQTIVEHNQLELKYDPARIDTLNQNSVIINHFTDVKNAEINIKNEGISFEVCSPFKNDLVKDEVRVKNEVVENLIKEDNNIDASFNSLNEFDNSFEAVHQTPVGISDKNLKTIEPIKDDNNFESSFNTLNEFDNSFEAVHETPVSISDKNLKNIEPVKSSFNSLNEFDNSIEAIPETSVSNYDKNLKTIEPVKDDNNFESSFNSVSDFDSSFDNSMDISDERADLKTVCQVCSKEENNYSILKTHYVSSHFTNEMKSQFGDLIVEKEHGAKKYQYCVVCNARFTSIRMALRHIGISHNKLNEILIYEGLTPLPDKIGEAYKRKAEKEEELIKKIKTEPVKDKGNLLSDGDHIKEIQKSEVSDLKSMENKLMEDNMAKEESILKSIALPLNQKTELDSGEAHQEENSKPKFEELKVNNHNESQEENVKIDSPRNISEASFSNSDKIKEEKKKEVKNMLKIEGTEEYKENIIEDEARAEEMLSEVASICQICQKTENPGLSLWNHYINSHYSSKRIVQEFGNLVRKKKCLVCNSKHSGTAAALKHVAVKHEKLNDLLILDGLVPLPTIGAKAGQEFNFVKTGQTDCTKNNPVSEIVSNNHQLKPMKPSAIEEQINVHNYEELMLSKKGEVDKTSVETSTNLTDLPNNDDEIENDDVKDPLVCQICNLKKSSILLIQKHYINSHYTRKIKSRFEHLIEGNYCENCDIEFRSTIQALIHVGIEHNKLNEILDEEGYLVLLAPKEEVSEVKSLDIKTVESEDSGDKYHADKEKPNTKTKNIPKVDISSSKMQLDHNKIEIEDNFKNQNTEQGESVKFGVDSKKETDSMPSRAAKESNITLNTNPLAKLTCDVCFEKFDKKNNFIRHTLSNRHYFTCDNCETNFRKKDKFDAHKNVCPAIKEETKNVVKNNSDDRTNIGLDQHKKLATEHNVAHDITKPKVAFKEPAPVMKIKTDPAPSNNANIEQINQMRTERKRSVTVSEITCEICGEKFNNKKIFFRHCLTKNHYFTCEVCGKSFKKRVEYTAHQQNCTM